MRVVDQEDRRNVDRWLILRYKDKPATAGKCDSCTSLRQALAAAAAAAAAGGGGGDVVAAGLTVQTLTAWNNYYSRCSLLAFMLYTCAIYSKSDHRHDLYL